MNDEECLKAIARGGRKAQRATAVLYDRYARRFSGYLLRRGVSAADAEDLIQDVFVKVFTSLQDKAQTIENGRAFLFRSLHNRYVDFMRAKRPTINESALGSDEDSGDIFELVVGGDDGEEDRMDFLLCLQKTLRRFYAESHEAGTAIDLAAIEGYSGRELADVLNRTHGATREFLSQCKKKFQALLIERCYEYMPESVRS